MKTTPRRPTDFDADRCRRRARLAAARDGIDAAPVGFLDYGTMDDDECLRLINMNLQSGPDLTPDDVYLHFVEAANSRFIGDRFMFLDASTLRNIAAAANGGGVAFMNSHRTGGLSAPSELPFGRAFTGRFEEFTDPTTSARIGRTTLGLYMLKGAHPNGAAGPSTDDLHRSIEAGTLADVSMGLAGGTRVCDVCGEDLTAKHPETNKFLCPHAPGTHRGMAAEHIEAQTARGVKGGKASYTLVDAMAQEVSAVYKGAVPGAGFRKAAALARSGGLSLTQLSEARAAYAGLLDRDDRTFAPVHGAYSPGGSKMNILDAFKFWKAAGEPEDINLESLAEPATPLQSPRSGAHPETVKLEDTPEFKSALAAEVARRERTASDARLAAEADAWFAAEVADERAVPAEKAALVGRYIRLGMDDRDNPADFSRLGDFTASREALKPHGRFRDMVPARQPSGQVLANGPGRPETPAEYAARVCLKYNGKNRITGCL